MFDLSPSALLTSLVISSVAFVLFSYGRKMNRLPHLLAGITLFALSWLVQSPGLALGLTVGILAALWYAVKRLGY